MKICEFAKYNEQGQQMCQITGNKCIYDWLFPDAIECYENERIYPKYSYLNRQLQDLDYSFYNNFGKGSKRILGLYISACKDGFRIGKDKHIYNKEEILKTLLFMENKKMKKN